MPGFRSVLIATAAIVGLLSGCNAKPEGPAVIGHAYAGPANLILHKEIESKSPAVTTVHHGDKLEIVGQKRRWYKVRAANGMEGWTSDRELLDTAQMKRLKGLAAETAGMSSQGVATTFSNLNVHTEPTRQSPSFVQMKEHEKVDVIAHKITPRTGTTEKRELIVPKPPPAKKEAKPSKIPEPPTPAPPEPPTDWRELSKNGEPPPDASATPSGPVDDWTLVRTEAGQSGWVLTSGLYLTIPDEVAQYAEGHRITSYFSVGKTQDGDIQKDIWLWTTSETLGEDHDFDSYRVFTWSLRHHRYETAYIQRRERGFFPVLAKTGAFSVCLERGDGSRIRKNYEMSGNAVRPSGESACNKTSEQATETANLPTGDATQSQTPKKGLVRRIEDKAKGLFNK